MNKADDSKVAAAIAEERRRNKEAIERKDVAIAEARRTVSSVTSSMLRDRGLRRSS